MPPGHNQMATLFGKVRPRPLVDKLKTTMAEANRAIASSLTPAPLRYSEVERWNGDVPKTLLSKDVGVLLGISGN